MDIRPAIGPAQPSNCIASGEGRSFGTAGFSASFFIQAVDYFGLYLSKGGETFQISMSQGSTSVIVDVTDGQLGSYSATFTATVSGTYTVQVLLAELPIKDSPFTVQILAAPISPAHCVAFGGALTLLTAGQQSFLGGTRILRPGRPAATHPTSGWRRRSARAHAHVESLAS